MTKLGLSAKKDEDFGEWYSQVVVESEMISYYDVSGTFVGFNRCPTETVLGLPPGPVLFYTD